jgi:(p)ppGpp synthase/HD superfamily hydrolase
MGIYSERYERALRLATTAHAGQKRKGTTIAYVTHPLHVARILERNGFGEELVVAGLLHDVVEDCGVSLEHIRSEFGDEVAGLVDAVTEKKREDGCERSWEERKREALEHLEEASVDAVALKAADALHNARTIEEDLRAHGHEVWQRFRRGARESLWYYGELATLACRRLGQHGLATELQQAVADLARTAKRCGDLTP